MSGLPRAHGAPVLQARFRVAPEDFQVEEIDGFEPTGEQLLVDPEVYAELVRSPDEGIAEFLDLSRVKPNTLGNTRMLKVL